MRDAGRKIAHNENIAANAEIILWDPCINCGESNSAEEEFCGGCGTNLKAALSKMAERIDKDIAQARFLMKEYRYAEAISLLKPITTAKHSRLTPLQAVQTIFLNNALTDSMS